MMRYVLSGAEARSEVMGRVESLGYRWHGSDRQEDAFFNPKTDHQFVLLAAPRWGRRIDIVTALSRFPSAAGTPAPAFHFDLGSQALMGLPGGVGRWDPRQVLSLIEAHLMPYLEAASSPAAILDLLLDGAVRPLGRKGPVGIVQHGYYLAKWWQLADRLPRLREAAAAVSEVDRVRLETAPWGRTELADVLWHDHELTPPPARQPWGFADVGDPRTEQWFLDVAAADASVELPHIRDTATPRPASGHIVRYTG